jgi:bifunctional DNA-binding transcriptional regulator/antitoxin component of YhaV-PrlF toxin-antitoxin module
MTTMERLVIDREGKITLPPEILQRRGLRAGDELAVLETGHGLLVCHEGLALLDDWWESLTETERAEARKEAAAYSALSEAERDAIWNEGTEELERWLDADEEEEGDEYAFAAEHSSG